MNRDGRNFQGRPKREILLAWDDYIEVSRLVYLAHGTTREELEARSKDMTTSFARRVTAFCLRQRGYSYPEIADVMDRCHTTIMRLCGVYDRRIGNVSKLAIRRAKKAAQAIFEQISSQPIPERPVLPTEPRISIAPRYCTSESYAFTSASLEMLAQAKAHEKARVWEAISDAAASRAA